MSGVDGGAAEVGECVDSGLVLRGADDGADGAAEGVGPFGAVTIERGDVADAETEACGGEFLLGALEPGVWSA